MPGFNQTGPMSQGAMTGKKLGKCTNFGAKSKQENTDETKATENMELMGRGFGRGLGSCGRGQGRGNRRGNRVNN